MWRPRTYPEAVAAVGNISESADLDFKEVLGTTDSARAELAKDVAAMTIHGGVIVIGMHQTNGLADAVTPVALHGLAERVQQVIDSRIRPAVAVDIDVLRLAPTDTDGLVVIDVPASRLAPHYANEKFPRRSGPVTTYMEEVEIAALYEQRHSLHDTRRAAGPHEFYAHPEGSHDSRSGGLGVLKLLVHPLGEIAVAGTPRLEEPLAKATADAWSTVSGTLAHAPRALELLREWSPRGTVGWKAGLASDELAEHHDQVLVAATYSYSGQLSARVSMPLEVGPARHAGRGREAFEHIWAAETCGLLALGGHFYEAVTGVGLLRVQLILEGLAGATASMSGASAVAITDDYYSENLLASPRELAADPVGIARRLLERFYVAFIDHSVDVFSRITTTGA
jgi:Schlafen, AlbA_2